MDDLKRLDLPSSRRDFISGAGTTVAAAALIPAFASAAPAPAISVSKGGPGTAGENARVTKNKVLGMWRPETIRATVNGKTSEPFGATPTGLLCFHESLHFVELMSDPKVPKFSGGARETGTAEEEKAAIAGNLALFGTYTVDEDGNFTGNTVQGCTFPNWIGTKRDAKQLKEIVDGNRMTEIFQSGEARVEIKWARVIG